MPSKESLIKLARSSPKSPFVAAFAVQMFGKKPPPDLEPEALEAWIEEQEGVFHSPRRNNQSLNEGFIDVELEWTREEQYSVTSTRVDVVFHQDTMSIELDEYVDEEGNIDEDRLNSAVFDFCVEQEAEVNRDYGDTDDEDSSFEEYGDLDCDDAQSRVFGYVEAYVENERDDD